MGWNGIKIKEQAAQKNIPLTKLANLICVSRQTVNDWIKGQVPKGNHLISLCKILQVEPNYFFSFQLDNSIFVPPLHRTRKTAKINPTMQKYALELAKEYLLLFRNDTDSAVVPVIRVSDRNQKNIIKTANELRSMSGISGDSPIDYEHTFDLMDNLGIKIIFRHFPKEIKSYAFYTKIYDHRIIFVNNSTNIIDLIFPLLHDSIHAIRDEVSFPKGYDQEEEDFCDQIANHIQFPDEYVKLVYNAISELPPGIQINKLKTFGEKYRHSLFGIISCIKSVFPDFDDSELNIGGADTNFKKKFPAIGDIIFSNEEPRDFVEMLSGLSPAFIKTIINQLDDLSNRKLGELLGLESALDAKEVKQELLKLKKKAGV